jgi:hypothetical protein
MILHSNESYIELHHQQKISDNNSFEMILYDSLVMNETNESCSYYQ